MTDYSKTIIYSIICNTDNSLIYVGHTLDFTTRKYHHKSNSKNHTKLLYQTIRENGNWENFTMKPIMEFPCENKIQARIQEQKCMVELKANLNSMKAHQTIEEKKRI
jgi:predicted GIY-YIG superfamily endonuclease